MTSCCTVTYQYDMQLRGSLGANPNTNTHPPRINVNIEPPIDYVCTKRQG